jgi:hypothetical protein
MLLEKILFESLKTLYFGPDVADSPLKIKKIFPGRRRQLPNCVRKGKTPCFIYTESVFKNDSSCLSFIRYL